MDRNGRKSFSSFFRKIFDNCICYISLRRLPGRNQGHLFTEKSFSFHNSLAFNAFYHSFLFLHCDQTLPFSFSAVPIIRFFISFQFLFLFFFVFYVILFIKLCLPHSSKVRSTTKFSFFSSSSFKAKSAEHASLAEAHRVGISAVGARALRQRC